MSLKRLLATWLPLAIVASVLCATTYVVVQQSFRMGANDLPTRVAADAAAALARGDEPAAVVGTETVDLATSLAPFVAVFDGEGRVVATSARLDGTVPEPPAGVLAAARANESNMVTWQPKAGVRMATVTLPASGGGTVMAGQSLRLAEAHIDQLGQLSALGWLAALVGSLVAVLVAARLAQARDGA